MTRFGPLSPTENIGDLGTRIRGESQGEGRRQNAACSANACDPTKTLIALYMSLTAPNAADSDVCPAGHRPPFLESPHSPTPMKSTHILFAAIAISLATSASANAADPPNPPAEKFELLDGDRVVFLGNTLIEREQKHGYWELMLTMAWPDRNVTFRNLGWSGDTVWGESRAGFGTKADGFKALVEQVSAAKPTVIFVGYGNVEAFDGEKGLPKFIDGFNKLLDVLEVTKARIVVLSPIKQDQLITPNRDFGVYHLEVDRYFAAMRETAERRSHRFIDLATETGELNAGLVRRTTPPRTTNGMDLTEWGYQELVPVLETQLPTPTELGFVPLVRDDGSPHPILVTIRKKNELFFHRWRPQNETYLFGFRKHEQGNNAKEVFEFDPLVAAEEKKIAELRIKLAAQMKRADDAK
jgi:hypothetical protein